MIITSVVLVGDLRLRSLTVNREKVTKSRRQSNVHDFVRCPGVLYLSAQESQLHLLPHHCVVKGVAERESRTAGRGGGGGSGSRKLFFLTWALEWASIIDGVV